MLVTNAFVSVVGEGGDGEVVLCAAVTIVVMYTIDFAVSALSNGVVVE